MEITAEQETNQVSIFGPHVVILGSGASRAACPKGDRNGKPLPLMRDLNEILKLKSLFSEWKESLPKNFEDTYSILAERGETTKIEELEKRTYTYFHRLRLPDSPTIYDYLVLSLRDTDLIATFNWDPLLVEAYARNRASGLDMPHLAFLHGNVAVSYCEKDRRMGNELLCPVCHRLYKPTKLLFPIREKDYASDGFIRTQWDVFEKALRQAFMITIFGYGGPKTDTKAIEAMKLAWGGAENRTLEQTTFITRDPKDEDQLIEEWADFVFSHHYSIYGDYYKSWIANHPRRTGEAWQNQNLEAKFISNNPAPKVNTLPELWQWFDRFKTAEEEVGKKEQRAKNQQSTPSSA